MTGIIYPLDKEGLASPCGYQPQKAVCFVCHIYIQDRDINGFEIQTIKMPGNKTGWTGLLLKTCTFTPYV